MLTERDVQKLFEDAGYFIGSGIDSIVFAVPPGYQEGDLVAKIYKPHLSEDQLAFYAQVTDRASQIAIEEDWGCNLGKHLERLSVRIVPFNDLVDLNGASVGISERIYGYRCDCRPNKVVDAYLTQLGEYIETRCHVVGIAISPFNARIDTDRQTLFITDLCDDINRLT